MGRKRDLFLLALALAAGAGRTWAQGDRIPSHPVSPPPRKKALRETRQRA